MGLITWGYLGLFSGSFLSATLLPFPSEGLLLAYLELDYPVWSCVLLASIANSLGGITNYFIGRFCGSDRIINRFKINENKLSLWEKRFSKHGYFIGLFSWLPIIGDPMLIALGFLKVKFWPLLFTVFIGKTARYAVVALLYLSIF